MLVSQSCPTLCDPMDCSLPGFSVMGIFQARRLEWIGHPLLQGFFQTQDPTCISCTAGRFFTIWATWVGRQLNTIAFNENTNGINWSVSGWLLPVLLNETGTSWSFCFTVSGIWWFPSWAELRWPPLRPHLKSITSRIPISEVLVVTTLTHAPGSPCSPQPRQHSGQSAAGRWGREAGRAESSAAGPPRGVQPCPPASWGLPRSHRRARPISPSFSSPWYGLPLWKTTTHQSGVWIQGLWGP